VTLPLGFAGLVMLLKEFGGTPVHLGRLIVNGGGTLMCRDMSVLMLLTLAALGFRLLSLAVRQVTLPLGFAGLVMLFEEFGGALVSLGRLVMRGGPALMIRDTPVLTLPMLPVCLTHEAKALT
jgi:hypothetical protein